MRFGRLPTSWLLVPALLAALAAGTAARADDLGPYRAEWGLGPLDFRDEFAISLTYLTLAADSPATLERGEARLALRGDWAQTIVVHDQIDAVLDAETVEVTPILHYGLTDRTELGLELPIVYRDGGVLDPAIRTLEGAFSDVRREREKRPDSRFRMSGRTDDGRTFDLDQGAGLGKLRLGLKLRPFDGNRLWPAVSIEAVAALPTGSPGFGTSGVDGGFRLALSKRLDDFVLYLGGTAIFPGGDLGAIEFEPLQLGSFGAVEYEIRPWLAAVYQGWVESPTIRNLDGPRGLIVYHGGGFKAAWSRYFAEIGVLENGADVTRSADAALHAEFGVTF